MDIDTINTSTNITRDIVDTVAPGPMTRARARQINNQVMSLMCTYNLTNENMMLHSCVNFLVLKRGSDKELEDETHSVLNIQATVLISCMGSTEPSIMHATSTTNKCKRSKEGLDFMDQNRPRVLGFLLAASEVHAGPSHQLDSALPEGVHSGHASAQYRPSTAVPSTINT